SLQPATLFSAEKVVSPCRTSHSSSAAFMASKDSAERIISFEFLVLSFELRAGYSRAIGESDHQRVSARATPLNPR
ncbi:MAG: hypothetical protein ACC742_12740, partial [Thermoanaerobaculales bacterium]